jgi:hypothetical protein
VSKLSRTKIKKEVDVLFILTKVIHSRDSFLCGRTDICNQMLGNLKRSSSFTNLPEGFWTLVDTTTGVGGVGDMF